MNHTRISHKQFFIGIVFMLISAFFVAFIALSGKILTTHTPLTTLIFLRSFLPLLIVSWVVFLTDNKLSADNMPLHGLRALFVTLSQYCLFYYLTQGSLLVGTLLYSTSPLFAPIISRFALGQGIKPKTIISIIISFIGVILIIKPNMHTVNLLALVGLGAGFFNACSQVTLHRCVQKQSPLIIAWIMYGLCSCIALFPFLIFFHESNIHFLFSGHAVSAIWLLLIFFAFSSITNQAARSMAYKQVNKASSLSPFLYASILFSGILDWWMYDLLPDRYSIVGALLIITGGVVMVVRKIK